MTFLKEPEIWTRLPLIQNHGNDFEKNKLVFVNVDVYRVIPSPCKNMANICKITLKFVTPSALFAKVINE